MADQTAIRNKIEHFDQEVLVPAYQEIQGALEKRGDKVTILPGYTGETVDLTDFMMHVMNAGCPNLDLLFDDFPTDEDIATGEEEYLGQSLFVVRKGVEPNKDGRGKFLVSNRLLLAPGDEVFTSPRVIYHMAFNGRFHIFEHRYDPNLANHRVEDVTREHILNHFLDSFDFFKMHANDSEPPW